MKIKFFILFILILVFYSSFAYAYTWEDFIIYCEKITSDEIVTNSNVKTGAQYILNNKNTISNNDMSRFDSFVLGKESNYYFVASNNMSLRAIGTTVARAEGFTTPNWSCQVNSNSISNVLNNKTPINQIYFNAFSPNINNTFGLVTGTINTQNRGFFNLYVPYTGPSFTPYSSKNINVYNNGNLLGVANRFRVWLCFP